jgi:two-component system chemotaxis response regulator CheB
MTAGGERAEGRAQRAEGKREGVNGRWQMADGGGQTAASGRHSELSKPALSEVEGRLGTRAFRHPPSALCPLPSALGALPSALCALPSDRLPPGIRSWRDGRVLKAAQRPYELVVVGCSMGGMKAVQEILEVLPKEFPLPIVIAQHRYRTSDESLPAFFRRHTKLDVVDADDKQWIRGGTVYLAPADYHLLVERNDGKGELSLSVDARVEHSRPSIDVLFESAAIAYGAGVISVVLTGANADGARGAAAIKRRGGFVIAQDPETAEAPAMPQAAIAATPVDRILPLPRIGPFLVELCRHSS